MVPSKLELECFKSFVNYTSLDLRQGLWYIVATNKDGGDKSNSNGGGKTSILDGISWILYGKTPSGLSKRQVVSHGAEEVRGKLTLTDPDGDLVVTRAFGKSESLQFEYGGEVSKGRGLAILQAKLDSILGVSFDSFASAIYLSKTAASVQFLYAPPSRRSELLSGIVDDSVFQTAGLALRDKRDGWNKDLGIQAQALATINGQLRALSGTVEDLERTRLAWEETERRRMAQVLGRLERYKELRKDLLARIRDNPVNEDMAELGLARGRAIQRREQLRVEYDQVVSKLSVTTLRAGLPCPTCRQAITEESLRGFRLEEAHFRAEADRLREEVAKLDSTLESIEKRVRASQLQQQARDSAMRDLENLATEEAFLRDELTSKSPEDLLKTLEGYRQELANLQQQKSAIEKSIDELPKKIDIAHQLYLAFTRDVKNIMFDAIRDALEDYTQQYLHRLTNGEFQVTYPTKSEAIRERFEIETRNGNYAQDISQFSEGEGWRASFAVLLALRRVICEKAGAKLSCLLVDDPIGGLDDYGVAEFCELLSDLADGEVPLLLATVPRIGFAHTSRYIHVLKEQGISRITPVPT